MEEGQSQRERDIWGLREKAEKKKKTGPKESLST